jgi:hypothetical protein
MGRIRIIWLEGVIGLKGTWAAWIIGPFGGFVVSSDSLENSGFIGAEYRSHMGPSQ